MKAIHQGGVMLDLQLIEINSKAGDSNQLPPAPLMIRFKLAVVQLIVI